jgi:hypothetical protein
MPQDDFYVEAANRRLNEIEAARAHALAALTGAKADNDYCSGTEAVQLIANLNAEEANLRRLHQQHIAAQNPPAPPQQTDQEWLSKPAHRMDYADVYRMANKSKYGVDESSFRAGIAEVAARRARGE